MRWLLCALLLLASVVPVGADEQWSSTTDFHAKVIYVVVRSDDLAKQALEQFTSDPQCTGESHWGYLIFIQREDKTEPGLWTTDEKPRYAGMIKTCKGR